MTNDKTTLNGSLDELGEIIANNLVTMGINDADPSDGLTTLAGKILNIETADNVNISTTITSNISIPSTQYYIDDTLTVTGTLTAGTLDDLNLNGLQGATIYMYNVGLNGDANDLMGQGTTNANGEFSIQGTFHKADYISIKLQFNETSHFLSATKYQNSLEIVQKKPISLPQNIENKWSLTPTTCVISVGSQYAGVPVSLFLDGSSYQTVNIDNSGNATFNISNLSDGSYSAQIKVVNHNKYADAQSNTFSLSSGVDIYLNPQLTLTSTKDILSYADNETATITAALETPGLDGEPIQGIPVSFTYDHQHHDVDNFDLGTYYKIEGSSGVLKIGDATNYVLIDFDNSLVQKSGSTTTYTWSEPISVTFENGYFLAGVVGMEEEDYPNIDFTNLYSYTDQNNGVITVTSWLGSQNTNANGLANITYESQGLGDISVTARIGSILIQTYDIEDCFKANLSASYSFGSSDSKYRIYEIPVCNAYEITGKLKSTANNRFTVCVKLDNTSDGNSLFRIGAYTTLEALIFDGSGIVIGNFYRQGSYTANTDIPFKMIYDNGTVKLYINDVLVNENTINYAPYNLMLHSYGNSKTVSVSDVKIKPL